MEELENKNLDINHGVLEEPVYIKLPLSLDDYKKRIFLEHIDGQSIPLTYTDPKTFIIVRPTGLSYSDLIRTKLINSGLEIDQQLDIYNFIKLSDVLYVLSE